MSVTVLAASNTFRLTTLDAVLAEIVLGDQVIFVESLIDQASAAIARECGTIFAQQHYREIQRGEFRTSTLFLRYWPLVAVTPVSYGTTFITDYRIESADAGMLYRHHGWSLWWGSPEEWTVDYIAGYILPDQIAPADMNGPTLREDAPDLERACIETIKVWHHERLVSARVESKTFGLTGDRIDYGVQAQRRALPVLAKDLLKNWKRLRVA